MEGVISTVNSSTSFLGNGAVFTGTYELVQHYTAITVSILWKQASAASGIVIDWSNDGVTTMLSEVLGQVPASGTDQFVSYQVPIRAAYARVKYTNGTVIQTTFNLQTIFHYALQPPTVGVPRMMQIEHNGQWYRVTVAQVNITTATTTSIAGAVVGTVHHVLEVHLTFSGAQTMSWLSDANVIIQPMSFAANGQLMVERSPHGAFMKTNSGQACS
jgi:hypothetical protein